MEKHGGEVERVELKYDKVTQRMRYSNHICLFGFCQHFERMSNLISQQALSCKKNSYLTRVELSH